MVDLPYDRRIDQGREVEFFTAQQLSHAEAGQRFGYTRSAMVSLVRDYRAGKLDLFAAARNPGTAPARERVHGRSPYNYLPAAQPGR